MRTPTGNHLVAAPPGLSHQSMTGDGLRRCSDTEGKGEGKRAREEAQLTLNTMEGSAKAEEAGWRRARGRRRRSEAEKMVRFAGLEATQQVLLKVEEEGDDAELPDMTAWPGKSQKCF